MNQNNQNGSVFFYILLAIALIAGLTYAVSRGNRGSTGMLTDEQARVAAQEIIDYGNTVANAVQKLRLRGCSDTEISFENNVSSDNYTNPNAPADKSCHVFDIAGGNINWLANKKLLAPTTINLNWDNWYYSAKDTVTGQGNDCANSSCSELLLSSWGLNRETCLKINESLDVDNPSGEPPTDDISGDPRFKGTYDYSATFVVGDTTPELDGKSAACLKDVPCPAYPSGECYVYYQVLIAR